MNAATALIMQGCACGLIAHPAVTATMASTMCPAVGTPVACDSEPYVEFDTVLEQMAGEPQSVQDAAGSTRATESRNEPGIRATCADPDADIEPARGDDGDEDADQSDSAVTQQMAMMASQRAWTAPVQSRALRRLTQDRADNRATPQVEGSRSGSPMDETAMRENASVSAEWPMHDADQNRDTSVLPGELTTTQSMDGQVDGAQSRPRAIELPIREPVTVSTKRPVSDTGRATAQAESETLRTLAPVTEQSMAPQVRERGTAHPERRTMIRLDMRGTVDTDGSTRTASDRLTVIGTEEAMAPEPEQPAEARSVDGQDRSPEQPERNTSASVEGRASRPEGAHTAVDQMNDLTAGQVDGAQSRPRAIEIPVRESTSASADRPVLNGSPRPAGVSVTEPRMAPRVQERTVAVVREREIAGPEGRTIILPDIRGTADPDGSTRVTPEWLTTIETEELITAEPEQLAKAPFVNGPHRTPEQPERNMSAPVEGRASRPEGAHTAVDQMNDLTAGQVDGAQSRPRATETPVPESTSARADRPAGDTGRTAAQVEPKNVRASGPVMEPDMAPRVQERTVAAVRERETAGPEGRTIVLPDIRGTADSEGSTLATTDGSAMAGTDELMAATSEQPDEAQSTDGQDRSPEQPEPDTMWPVDGRPPQSEGAYTAADRMNGETADQVDGAQGRPGATETPVRECNSASTEQLTGNSGHIATQAEPKNVHTSAPVMERGMAPEMVDVTHGKATKAEMAGSRQTALRPIAPRKEGTMTASRVVTVSRGWPQALVRSALVESLARHRNVPNPLWDDELQEVEQARSQPNEPRLTQQEQEQEHSVSSVPDQVGRREPTPAARPELAVSGDPVLASTPVEGPDVSQTPQAARPALTEQAGSSVTRQIASHMSARAAQGGGVFRARLVPEHLGGVEIRVRVVRGVCTADIRADDAEVARYIESHSSDLKVSLAEYGVNLAGLSVSSRSRAQEGWNVATPAQSEAHWSGPNWNGANARQQYAAATFAGGSWGDGRGERRGALMESSPGVASPHSAIGQSGSPSPDEPIMARWARGYARIDYLA